MKFSKEDKKLLKQWLIIKQRLLHIKTFLDFFRIIDLLDTCYMGLLF